MLYDLANTILSLPLIRTKPAPLLNHTPERQPLRNTDGLSPATGIDTCLSQPATHLLIFIMQTVRKRIMNLFAPHRETGLDNLKEAIPFLVGQLLLRLYIDA